MRQLLNKLQREKSLLGFLLGISVLWTVVAISSVLWNLSNAKIETLELARTEARTSFYKDLIFRRWAASHGGLYIPISETVQPSSHLSHIKERDIQTPSGRKLTLVNPAYMIRLMHEMSNKEFGIKSHVTSLKPLRKENSPDEWETSALLTLDTGVKEVSELVRQNEDTHLRLIRPLFAEENCLKCHNTQGYKINDLVGGISVSLPFDPYRSVIRANTIRILIAHGLIWILGLVGIGIGTRRISCHIQEREDASENLKAQERHFRALIEKSTDIIVLLSENGTVKWCSPSLQRHLGHSNTDPIGRKAIDFIHEQDIQLAIEKGIQILNLQDQTISGTLRIKHRDGSYRMMDGVVTNLLSDPDVEAIVINCRDISDREKLEAQLRQSQKMEAIGQLAGGVAHDFNNMLSVINGYSEIALLTMQPTDPLYKGIKQINNAGQRSAGLINQLLAFARKQTIAPQVLDLNNSIESILKMLQRLIGENIELHWNPVPKLWPVLIDPIQIDQVLANLAVNARDAIDDVGMVSIETGMVKIDEAFLKHHVGIKPGDHVVLTVTDNGRGMDKETVNKIFEPFFTTKPTGQGTGLGLATVYGIIKQNNGFIDVTSKIGKGTTFKIYLPRQTQGLFSDEMHELPVDQFGTATVLLVEDESDLLLLTQNMLEKLGYTVFAANTPNEAISLAEEHQSDIQLLLTDVVMPEMNGRDLMINLSRICPLLKTIFMSGYTDDVIAHHGILEEGINFIQKPFTLSVLSKKIREVLDAE